VPTEAIDPWLEALFERGGTDLLLTAGSPPRIRVDGSLRPLAGEPRLDGRQVDHVVQGLLDAGLLERFRSQHDVDFSLSWRDLARLRCNAFQQKGQTTLGLRMIPSAIPSFGQLGLPPVATWVADLPRGLVLVTGPTGSGKSTTLASIVDYINENRALHILTIEDPIEYVHAHKLSAVNQREVGIDCESFQRALRSALREDPDVLLIGEMRDLESIQIALTMAETGHLVLATLHTNDAAQAVDRIIDVFPADRQEHVRVQLASSLAAVIAQQLLPRAGGGIVAAFEVLVATSASRNLIREGKSNQLRNVMTTNQREGMGTLEMHLSELIRAGVITHETGLGVSIYPKELARSLAAVGVAPGREAPGA
jgi:twitching motility protein PilT